MELTNLYKFLDGVSAEVLAEYKKQLGENSDLANSLSFSIDKANGTTFNVAINLEDYWIYVENGRKPGSKPPPFNDILTWVKKKNLPLGWQGKLYTVEQVAKRIQLSIGKRGVKGKHYLEKAVESASLDELLEEALAKDVEKELLQTLNKL